MLYKKLSNSYNLTAQRKQQPNCVWPRQNLPSTIRYCRLRYLWHVTRIGLMASFAKVWAHVFLQKARGTVPMLKTNVDRTGGIWKPLFSKSALFPGTQFSKFMCSISNCLPSNIRPRRTYSHHFLMPRIVPQPFQPKKQGLFDLGILDDVFIMKAYITKNESFSGDDKTLCKESGP